MADATDKIEAKKADMRHDRLEAAALQIYAASMASGVHNLHLKIAARRAFAGAKAFLDMSDAIANGDPILETAAQQGPFQKCFSPVLSPRDPINIIAERHQRRDGSYAGGDLQLIKRIWERIKGIDLSNPEIPHQIEDPELGLHWGRREIATAKLVFPPFLEKASVASN